MTFKDFEDFPIEISMVLGLVHDRNGCFGRCFGRTEPKRFGSAEIKISPKHQNFLIRPKQRKNSKISKILHKYEKQNFKNQ